MGGGGAYGFVEGDLWVGRRVVVYGGDWWSVEGV